jgi:formylglycine-generating enzyme required for sulfatase activity
LIIVGSVSISSIKVTEAAEKLTPAELFRHASPAIARIYRYDADGVVDGQGTGFFISDDGLLVTNHHVIDGGRSWQVVLSDDRVLKVAGIISSSQRADLAIMQVSDRWLPHLRLAGEQLPEPGEKVLAIGNPLGLTNTISDGLLSGYREAFGKPRMLQISAPVSQGSSGGPLFVDGDPRVVGVTTAVMGRGQNLNFAVPVQEIHRLLRRSANRIVNDDEPVARKMFSAISQGAVAELEQILHPRITYQTEAPTIVYGDDEYCYFRWEIDPSALVNGRNVLAVEVHQRGSVSSDMGFDLQLTAGKNDTTVLVPQGSSWKYLDDGSDQGEAWQQPQFDDAAWKSGPGKLGFEDDANTVVSFGSNENEKHITTYFRHAFEVSDIEPLRPLTLWLLRDDGAVVYLNGRRVASDNIAAEISVAYENARGETPLHLAAASGHEAIVALLMDHGARLNSRTREGQTPFDLASAKGHSTIVAMLRQKGGDSAKAFDELAIFMNAVRAGDIAKVEAAARSGTDLNRRDAGGATALHHAAFAGQTDIVRFLLDHNANVDLADADDYTPLQIAVLHGRVEIAKLLLEHGADPNAKRRGGMTCLAAACHAGRMEIAALLLDYGADIESRTGVATDRTPLHLALKHYGMVRLLIERGADVNAQDRYGLTPLTYAGRRGWIEVCELLQGRGGRVAAPLGMRTRLPKFQADTVNSIGVPLRKIAPGPFQMGSPESERGRAVYERQHEVTLEHEFYIGTTEVTREQFEMFVAETNYEPFREKTELESDPDESGLWSRSERTWDSPGIEQADGHPAVMVSWEDANAFCQWLSAREGKTYRLPTEAEWEYACRAGTDTPFYCGPTVRALKENCWCQYSREDNSSTQPVGSFKPNAWGLFDMHGNVQEWTSDAFSELEAATEPNELYRGDGRAIRGGSWRTRPNQCRSANRMSGNKDQGYDDVGFRIVRAD